MGIKSRRDRRVAARLRWDLVIFPIGAVLFTLLRTWIVRYPIAFGNGYVHVYAEPAKMANVQTATHTGTCIQTFYGYNPVCDHNLGRLGE